MSSHCLVCAAEDILTELSLNITLERVEVIMKILQPLFPWEQEYPDIKLHDETCEQ